MNCQEFQDILFEYVEGSVSQEQRTDADSHVARCAECNAALRREKQMQQRLSSGLQQSVEALNLGSQGRAQLLKVLEANRPSCRRSQAQVFAELWVRVVAALGAAAVIAGLAVWIWRPGVSPQIAKETNPTPVAAQVSKAKPTIQIRLPGLVTSYTFQQNGDFVVDTFDEQTNFVNVTLWNEDHEPVERKGKESKMPL